MIQGINSHDVEYFYVILKLFYSKTMTRGFDNMLLLSPQHGKSSHMLHKVVDETIYPFIKFKLAIVKYSPMG